MKIIKILTIIILTLFPFGEFLRFDLGNHIAVKPLDMALIACVTCWLVLAKKNKSYLKWPILFFPFIGFISLTLNSTWLQPNQFLVSFLYLFRWILYALMVFVVLQFDKEFKRKIIIFLFVDGLILLILGYVQYFFYNSLGNLFYLGWDVHMHRIFSTFFDPNFAGAFFVLYFIFIAGGIAHLLEKKEKKVALVFSFILVLTLIAIFLTFSRSALLMLIVGSMVFLTLIQKKKLALLVLGAIFLFVVIASPKFNDENMNLFRMNSTEARIASYSFALQVIQDRPILGVGFNTYRYTKDLYGLNHDWVDAPSHADAGVDNSFLFVLATTGVIGFVAYAWLWSTIIKRAFYLHKKRFNHGAVVVISSLCALFIDALFINSMFFVSLMLWMWIMIAVMEDINSL